MNEPESAGVQSTIRLGQIAHARSGDKGPHANIGVAAHCPAGYDWLQQHLTPDRIEAFFDELPITRVERHLLPRVHAMNFVLYDALDGGAGSAMRLDTQGKLLGVALLELRLPAPDDLTDLLPHPENR